MEGSRRVVVAWLAAAACALCVGATGCGDDEPAAAGPDTIRTANPERTFAPLIELAADEPWRPMSARWFIERSSFWFAEDRGCPDRKIAVGHSMPEQQDPRIDWIYPKGLGDGKDPNYYRNPNGKKCDLNLAAIVFTDQLTRPFDRGPRVDGLRPRQGFYLDLADEARGGPSARSGAAVPAYAERVDEGDSRVRLAYWVLFGMRGRPGEPGAHEGDWKRIDVLLSDRGDDRYEPVGVQTEDDGVWDGVRLVDTTHPVVRLERATHAIGVVMSGERCATCTQWQTWKLLRDARKELWYGFGGAWGEVGSTSATTGPLGPHRLWPTVAEKHRDYLDGS